MSPHEDPSASPTAVIERAGAAFNQIMLGGRALVEQYIDGLARSNASEMKALHADLKAGARINLIVSFGAAPAVTGWLERDGFAPTQLFCFEPGVPPDRLKLN